jgi:hypothetical protein
MYKFILLVSSLLSLQLSASPDPGKVRKNLVGTWKFSQFWNPYRNEGEPGRKSTDPKDLYTAYTFYEDGRVVIWSLDSVQNKMGRQTASWGVVLLKDENGKEHAVVKIVDPAIDPQNQQAIEQSTSGLSFLVVQASKSFLAWIKIPQYHKANSRDWQSTYKKIDGADL